MSLIIKNDDGREFIDLLALFESANNPAVMAPFNGAVVPVIARRLNHVQIKSCGDFSLIETMGDYMMKTKDINVEKMVEFSQMQYKLLEACLVSPSYDQIMSMNKLDKLRVQAEETLQEIEDILNDDTLMPKGPKRDRLKVDYYSAMMNSLFLLPADFVGHMVSFALSIDVSDIKLITEDMLHEAAIMASNGHDNPADHLEGNFTAFNNEDINRRAWVIYHQRKAEIKDGR